MFQPVFNNKNVFLSFAFLKTTCVLQPEEVVSQYSPNLVGYPLIISECTFYYFQFLLSYIYIFYLINFTFINWQFVLFIYFQSDIHRILKNAITSFNDNLCIFIIPMRYFAVMSCRKTFVHVSWSVEQSISVGDTSNKPFS